MEGTCKVEIVPTTAITGLLSVAMQRGKCCHATYTFGSTPKTSRALRGLGFNCTELRTYPLNGSSYKGNKGGPYCYYKQQTSERPIYLLLLSTISERMGCERYLDGQCDRVWTALVVCPKFVVAA